MKNLKNIQLTLRFLITVMIITVCLIGCKDKDDYVFNYDYVEELYDKTFPIKDIDPSQNWKTTRVVEVNMAVYKEYGEIYQLFIYSENPLNDKSARILGKGTVTNGETYSVKVDCPIDKPSLYIACMNSKNRILVQQYEVTSEVINADFGTKIVNRAVISKKSLVARVVEDEYEVSWGDFGIDLDEVRKDEYELTDEIIAGWNGEKNGMFWIKPDVIVNNKFYPAYNGKINGGKSGSIVLVEGIWNLYDFIQFGPNWTIVVAEGGSLNISGNVQMNTANSRIVVSEGGNLNINSGGILDVNGKHELPSFYNAGTCTVFEGGNLKTNDGNAYLYNCGFMDITSIKNNLSITNFGKMEVGRTDGDWSNLIRNFCFINVRENFSAKEILMGERSRLDVGGKLHLSNEITFGNESVITAGVLAADQSTHIYGPEELDNFAILKIGSLAVQNPVHFGNGNKKSKVYVDWDKSNSGDQYQAEQTIKEITYWVSESTADLFIPSDDVDGCTGVGYGGTEPVEPPVEEGKTMSYVYCFEDYFPKPGDYDFNDLVMSVEYEIEKKNGMVSSLEVDISLDAVGATYQLAAALQLIGVDNSMIKSVSLESDNGRHQAFVSDIFNDSEVGKNNAPIIPLFGDAHYLLSGNTNRYTYNTAVGHENGDFSSQTLELEIEFNESNAPEDITLDNLDLFVARSLPEGGYYAGNEGKSRVEIHLYNFWSEKTQRAVNFIENEIAAKNRTWAICVPYFRYPYETVSIEKAYCEPGHSFQEWAQDKNMALDWYEYPSSDKVY